ncbi:hypothetical protein, variant 1 [Aphanomyces invadans]|uniref:Uncharacterized protein n=1 Tax=Aphanomyces invadans TaxID=157072 RepID=A0A024TTK0_9STRA|nr:hypothetical protein, variant 1 [Aphanomyces invadans]ETV97470.1 hypothetical protein, variant 1 [Aphanomyces invadans]|eukprot:XP_008873680.1 hypothetical protein, variant 1 [Aphanomyces invadans]
MARRGSVGKTPLQDGLDKSSVASRRFPTVVRTVSAVNTFNSHMKKRIKRRAGWTRKQATLDDVTRHCKAHMDRMGTLPPMSIDIKLDSIEKAVRANVTFKGEWTTFYWNKFFFRSPIVTHMITDLFWWATLIFFNQTDTIAVPPDCYAHVVQAHVQNQVAVHFGKLLTKVLYMTLPTGAADEFLDYFPYCVSRTVYKALQKAYPDFIVQMRHSLPHLMIDTISQWTTGVKAKSASWSTWRVEIQTRKLRHGPKPHVVVREVLDEGTVHEEEILSDDSNDADYLSDDESIAVVEFEADDADGDAPGPPVDVQHSQTSPHPATAPCRSKVSLKFSPSVDKIVRMYKYTGYQGRKLGHTMTVTDGACSAVDHHIQQHERYLQHVEHVSAALRSSRSLGALASTASLVLDTASTDKGPRLATCEFEIKNPVSEARQRRLSEAKMRHHEVSLVRFIDCTGSLPSMSELPHLAIVLTAIPSF